MKQQKEKKIWKAEYGVVVFFRGKKINEIKFKTEKDMAYWIYKNDRNELTYEKL